VGAVAGMIPPGYRPPRASDTLSKVSSVYPARRFLEGKHVMTMDRETKGRSRPGTATLGRPALTAALLAVLTLPLTTSCSTKEKRQGGPPGGAVPVTVAEAVRRDVPVTMKAIGSVEAYRTVNVRARVGGELDRVSFTEGQNVRAGALLFTIDPRPYEAALQQAIADSASSAAKTVSADSQERRSAELAQNKYITQEQYEQARANAEALHAQVRADAAACRTARLNLSFCSIQTPISGRTGSLLVHQGNLIKANDDLLVVIQQLVPAYVVFSVPEQRLPEIRMHAAAGELRVLATATDDSARVQTGELTFIDNAVDETTGTIRLKATFPNQDESLWPGQFMNVTLVLAVQSGAIVIPAQAVQKGQQGDYVYVVKPDLTATIQPIKTGMRLDDTVVVDEGIAEGDRVVTDGQLRLVANAKVDIKSAPQPAGTPTR
jgi:membrane fusion protein, multidrug efflux system